MNHNNKTIDAGELLRALEKERQWWETRKAKLAHVGMDTWLAAGHIRGIEEAIDLVKEMSK